MDDDYEDELIEKIANDVSDIKRTLLRLVEALATTASTETKTTAIE